MVSPLTLISRGVPAYTNDDFSGAFPASNANNAIYGGSNYWRCLTAPVGGTDSGVLTTPVYLAYDLSGVDASLRQNVVLAWYNDPSTDVWNSSLIGQNYFNVPSSYTIEINSAAGGSYPMSGWTVKATETNSPYHSKQHVIAMSGANWIQINITAILGSALNNNAAINMDVFSYTGASPLDTWLMIGDSITQRGLDHSDSGSGGSSLGPVLPAQIQTLLPANLPVMEDGGIGGYSAQDAAALIATWVATTSAHYICLNFGTNDANSGGALVTNFQTNMTTCITAILAADKVPVIPTIPWGSTAGLLANVPTLNTVIAGLYTTYPQIVHGPDLYTFFNANQSLIGGDGIHPTDPAGYTAYRAQWAQALVTNLYTLSSGQAYVIRKKAIGVLV